MNEIMSHVLAVWASPVEAIIAFVILAGVVFWLYKWAQHAPQARDAEGHIGEAQPGRRPLTLS
jgi:large-conductance mechanosensitive channel